MERREIVGTTRRATTLWVVTVVGMAALFAVVPVAEAHHRPDHHGGGKPTPAPTASPTPDPSPSPSPEPTPTPSSQPTPSPTPSPSAVDTPEGCAGVANAGINAACDFVYQDGDVRVYGTTTYLFCHPSLPTCPSASIEVTLTTLDGSWVAGCSGISACGDQRSVDIPSGTTLRCEVYAWPDAVFGCASSDV